jgi:repressor LexA
MLTTREQQALDFIADFIQTHSKSPVFSEISQGLGIQAKSHIHRILKALENKGYIERTRQHRSIKILKTPQSRAKSENAKKHDVNAMTESQLTQSRISNSSRSNLQLVGSIAAGNPIEAIEVPEIIDINQMFAADNHFLLKVRGDSMQDIGIVDGDYVVIEQTQQVNNGDVVVALIDNLEATLKRIQFLTNDHIRLIPENQHLIAKDYLRSRINIQGRLIGQFRHY